MDGLDKITLILMVCLVAVALLFPLSSGKRADRDDGRDAGNGEQKKRR